MTKIDPNLFEYEPQEVSDDEIFQEYQTLGMTPETAPDYDKIAYAAWLEKKNVP